MTDNYYNYNQQYSSQPYGYQQQQYSSQQPYGQQQQQYSTFETQAQYNNPPQQQNDFWVAPNQTTFIKVHELDFDARKGFVIKVYALLVIELSITLGLIALAMNTNMGSWLAQKLRDPFNGQEYVYVTAFYWCCFSFSLVFQIALFCCHHLARKVPVNYFLLFGYIVFFGFMLSGACQIVNLYGQIQAFPGQKYVWIAWGITFSVVISLTAYACTTKEDMTVKGGFIFVLFLPLTICVFLSIFMFSEILYIIICSFLIIIYGFYLIWETQIIMGGKKFQLSIDDYIIGSLLLYGTIIQLFIRILEIMLLKRK